jgi:hypothetical protein
MSTASKRASVTFLLAAAWLALASDAQAGCGCTKPPPPPAAVRPSFAWSGAEVTVFDPALVAGDEYRVTFHPPAGFRSRSVVTTALERRDLADGVVRPQLVVALPELPLGPAQVRIEDLTNHRVLRLHADRHFTVAPHPIGVPNGVGVYRFERYRAAVSREGTVLVSLDFGDIQHARVFEARALDLPLRFGNEDLAFYNVQGFLMQLLGKGMPGLYAIGAAEGGQSDLLRYSRHEFNTYFLQHGERGEHGHLVDPTDPNWHLDGTPHIDHDHQILAIEARLPGGSAPAPGATAPFTLEVRTETLFSHGVVGESALAVHDEARVQSYQLAGGEVVTGGNGDVVSNGQVAVTDDAIVHGDATAQSFLVESGGWITGLLQTLQAPLDLLPVDVPSGLVDLGELVVEGPETLDVGSYRVARLEVREGGVLYVDNAAGPVTIYATELVGLDHGGSMVTASDDPEKFALYLAEGAEARLSDGAGFHGVVYGPAASVRLDSGGVLRGALVGGDVELSSGAELLYYAPLHRNDCATNPPTLNVAADIELVPGELLLLPGSLVAALLGWQARIDGREFPLAILGPIVGLLVPPDLEPGRQAELTLVDAKGCRSRRTVMAEVVEPGVSFACGLFGIEVGVVPLFAALLRRRARLMTRRAHS